MAGLLAAPPLLNQAIRTAQPKMLQAGSGGPAPTNTMITQQPPVQPQPPQSPAPPQQQPQGGNTIPYWGSFGGNYTGFDYDPSTTGMGREFLEGIRKYDPNASFTAHQMGGEGGSGQNTWSLNADLSKIPDMVKNIDMNKGAYNPVYYSPMSNAGSSESYFREHNQHDFDRSQLYNPNMTRMDPVLGQVTDRKNLRPQQRTWLDTVGPMLVGGFGGMLGGAGWLSSLAQKAPGMLNSWSHGQFDPFSLASMAVPFIPGMQGLPGTIAKVGLNYAGSQRRGR